MLINPGPAISNFSIVGFPESAFTTISAISRGGFPAAFASTNAIDVA